MALRWLVHLVCTSAFEYPKDDFNAYSKNGNDSRTTMRYSNGGENCQGTCPTAFEMPLHYPRYKKDDYERMEEWKVDLLLKEYGLSFEGSLDEKRSFAMGAFLWPDQV